MNADKEMFRLLAHNCRDGIRAKPDGTLPLDVELKRLIDHPKIVKLLTHLPAVKERQAPKKGEKSENSGVLSSINKLHAKIDSVARGRGKQGQRQTEGQRQNV